MEDQILSQSDVNESQVEAPGRTYGNGEVARLLERLRNERGLSKADLAKQSRLDPSTITRFEQGSRNPDRDTVMQLAQAMSLPLVERDRLLAAAGYRSEVWDDPLLVELSHILADRETSSAIREEVRSVLRSGGGLRPPQAAMRSLTLRCRTQVGRRTNASGALLRPALLLTVGVILLLPFGLPHHRFTQICPGAELPTVELDALDAYRWSLSELRVAPGQTIVVTNRGVLQHNFSVLEWGMQVPLPTLEPVEIVVPSDVQPGDQFSFFCSEPGHRSNGQEGVITIVSAEEAIASASSGDTEANRVVVETRDDFTWSPSSLSIAPGQFIEVRNPGVLEHHFVVDDWDINVTVSAGEVQLVQAPLDLVEGDVYIFYCSVPGHLAGGMEGTITVTAAPTVRGGTSPGGTGRQGAENIDRFLPDAADFGDGWELVRTGNARAVLADYDNVSPKVFPGEGRGATYVGPAGSRVTILVLPFAPAGVPTNQVEDAVLNVQLLLMAEWEADLRDSISLNMISPPAGCDVANRQSGVTRVYTLPAGSTVCQLRSAGIAIFVAIEGEYGTASGVAAADQLIVRLLDSV